MDELGSGLFGAGRFQAAVWPEGGVDAGERGAFLWGRLKGAGAEGFATHIGVFVSAGLCNLSIDLEKDLLDARQSGESLAQVLEFFRSGLAATLGPTTPAALSVWTDTRNVVAARDFDSVDFSAFLNANRDADHPWPKIGYILTAEEVQGFGERWVEEYRSRGAPLIAVYETMIRTFAA
jgi:hypothetical protein